LGNRAGANLDFATAYLYMMVAYGGGETGFEIVNMGRETARAPVLAAGGIVLRSGETPLIAVVRLRKRNEWVLPKGKLDDGENAARRRRARGTGRNWT
jgi:hypothetical protein